MDPTHKAVAILPRRDSRGRRIGRRQGRTDAEKAQAQAEQLAQRLHEMWVEATSSMIAHVPEEQKAKIASKLTSWDDLHPSTRRSLVARAEKVLEELYHLSSKAAETFTPPRAAQDNARRVLQWRKDYPDEIRGMTATGWTRARQLADGGGLSLETVQRIAAFERHRENAKVAEEYRATPWKDAGHVAWLGWGGNEGIAWAQRVAEQQRARKAMNEGTPEQGGNTVPTTTGDLNIEIRDRYRATQLRRLPDDQLIDAHNDLHELFGKRPEGAAVERYVNSHVAILPIFAERNIPHPKPPKGTGELDQLTLDLQKAANGDRKARATMPVHIEPEHLGRIVPLDEVVQILDKPFRLVPVYLAGGVVDNEDGTQGTVDVVIPNYDTLPPWLQWAIRTRLVVGAPYDLEDRWSLTGGVGGLPITDHVLLGHLGFIPLDGDLEVVEMSAAPVAEDDPPQGDSEPAADDEPTEDDEPTHKASDPFTEYPDKPARQLAVLQAHAIGKGHHLDLRMQLNKDELIGWTLHAGALGSADAEAETLADARDMVEDYSADDGNRFFKPLRSPAKLGANPKLTHPPQWLQMQGVMDPGEAGATDKLPGVLAMVEGPDRLSATWGAQKPDYHEYFLEVDGRDAHDLAGVLSIRSFEGRAQPGDEEVSEGRKTPEGDRAWIATIEDDPVPYVLTDRAVKAGWMPPDGQHALPLGIAEKIPEKLRYWTKSGAEARKVRDFLVQTGLVNKDTARVVGGKFTLQPQEEKAQGTGAGPDADAPAGADPSSGASPVDGTVEMQVAKAWLGPRRADGSRMMKAVVYAPMEIDAHGDWTTGDVILDAQIFHSLKGMRLNLEHNRERERLPAGEAKVVQTYTADVTFKVEDLFGKEQVIPQDTWIMGAILRGKTLRKAERGQINGWSFEGLARSARVR